MITLEECQYSYFSNNVKPRISILKIFYWTKFWSNHQKENEWQKTIKKIISATHLVVFFFLYIYVKFVCTCNRQQCTADIPICNNRVLKMKHEQNKREKQNCQYLLFDKFCKTVRLQGVFHDQRIMNTAD